MAQVNRNTLKSWFIRGAKPLAAQFADWIDSFWHKEDTLPIGSVENLTDELNKRATAESVRNVETRVATLENATHVSAHADLTGKNDEADVQHLTEAEKAQITTNKNDIAYLRALKTLITVSQNIIEVDCSKDLIETTNNGTSTAVFSFINLPSQKGTVRIKVKNARTTDFTITLPYLNIVVGGVTYSFKNMTLSGASLICFSGKSIEISFLFIKTSETAYTISITALHEY